ncbi:hypothetical protein [Pararhizobium arenae]|uniref:hypothetical protein n=1 Tax=Pararhizobium arenae TaxID=1856850 RepID=UPI001AECD8B9|nr:hypothetical protein [Pararhizobium arenae]
MRHSYELAVRAIDVKGVPEEVRLLGCGVRQWAGPFINQPISEPANCALSNNRSSG